MPDLDAEPGDGPREIMTVEQAAQWLGLHPQTVRNEIRAQRLPAKRIGKEWRLSRTAIIRWLSTPEDDLERYSRRSPGESGGGGSASPDLAAEDGPAYRAGPSADPGLP